MISKILDNIPAELLKHTPGDEAIAPSFYELDCLAAIDGVDKRVIAVYDGSNVLVGCAVCFVESRKYHGLFLNVYSLFGYLLHDYNRIFCYGKEAMESLKRAAVTDAKANQCDIIVWENIPVELVPDGGLPTQSAMKIFSAPDSLYGWCELYNRKSVKRFTNKAKRVGVYTVEVIDGEVDDRLMDELKQFHILRWNFAQSGSAFSSNPKRKDEYKAVTRNKHYLRILINGELLACHYGMRYGRTLLWHTPIINPKYLELSPLRLLLAETARYCENNSFEMIDFGLGDEAYKDAYCNKKRETCYYYKPLSVKGYLAEQIGGIDKSFFIRHASAVKLALMRQRLRFFKPEVLVYEHHSDNKVVEVCNSFKIITSWPEFYDFAIAHNFQPLEWHHNRFIHDNSTRFIAINDEKTIYSYGWTSVKNPFLVGENGKYIDLDGKTCLYDFVTPMEHRNKGYYTKLLKSANALFGGTVIYAKKSNIPSRKAIERSGFTLVRNCWTNV